MGMTPAQRRAMAKKLISARNGYQGVNLLPDKAASQEPVSKPVMTSPLPPPIPPSPASTIEQDDGFMKRFPYYMLFMIIAMGILLILGEHLLQNGCF